MLINTSGVDQYQYFYMISITFDIDVSKAYRDIGLSLSNRAQGVWYITNIPRLRAVHLHDATRSAWTQSLAVVYWPNITNPQVPYCYCKLITNVIRAVKIHVLSYL
jgi:hypothetical protein